MAQDKVSIRISKEDMQKFNELAFSLSMTKTAVIKKIVNDGFAQTVEITNDDLLASFSKIEKMLESIGNNVNQMARKVNAGGRFTEQDSKTLEQVSDRFEKLYDFVATKTKKAVIKKRGSK
ncbi:plasmid mobilization relaxosome protein MobC [Pseudomonas lactis]|uniref:plasmid mobilization relaxosome protein MobC n=1 Tax=Pseudomonas TaxID=286 RepID=UPI000BB5CD26|nr:MULTISPECIES: plasmid mobilization relaxosome protein MobC [Pseudomonas]MDE1531532.1 plasmid mobilization relaxosome protein MobC [Pseudomonas carnis]HBP0235512.1 MobC family plasmid mobilization relaxosome protein [Pseudomonas aeruginosa]MBA5957739.1 plasmid mobilization relaxosome protein MobC [Pseudomonas lactis]MBJ2219114.1 plasmid mobilization relaxosome protein MobC [Pseudomonas sp. MF7453]PRW77303.1 plasmid mobilization relaxosome protein MobC [Pseudomonas fluorescens]